MSFNPKDVYHRECEGRHITDADVISGIVFYKNLSDSLVRCGPVFKLAFIEANRMYYTLSGYAKARELSIPEDF